jgi:hypothetical protein
VIHLKLSYFELLSPDPINIQNVGGILSPTLRSISKVGINIYQYYLSIILMDLKTYFSMIKQEEQFESLSDEDKAKLNVYDLITMSDDSAKLLQDVLNFFIYEDVIWSKEQNAFLVYKENSVIGMITKEIYPQICDLICQRTCIKSNIEEDLSKVKSKKALEIMKKLQKGRAEKAKNTKSDKNMELGNIISAVANKSQSLNIINIWEITVYQLWDCFSRISNNNIYDIQSMSVAAYGNKDNYFDSTAWFKRIDTTN